MSNLQNMSDIARNSANASIGTICREGLRLRSIVPGTQAKG